MLTHDQIDELLEGLDAATVRDIQIEEVVTRGAEPSLCLARCGPRRAYIDRALARDLRHLGAAWCGDVRRDPCAVA